MHFVKIKISLEKINDYEEIFNKDNSIKYIDHDGTFIPEELLSVLQSHIIDNYDDDDETKIHEFEFVDPSYITDNIQATGNVDITAYTKTSPYPSWVIGSDGEWNPPKPYPDGNGSGMGTLYSWNEETTSWKDILV
tara:strand:- start:133 stop:540 length:408 start_codon:yes stop_codon:yes gene_type:complete